jgi:DNA-binding NarL/FixJ family response regulator
MRRPRILVVDDHAGFREMAGDLLAGAGFDVVGEAVDGRGAIDAVATLRPAVVLLDVRLPDLDGFEVTRRLLAGPEPPTVVLVSTREAADYGRRIQRSGAAGFISKARLSGDTLLAILDGQEEASQ